MGTAKTIRGGRSGSLFGSKLSIGSQTDATIFGVTGDDVRITGLRLQGPNTNRSTDDGQPNSWAIRIPQPPAAETAVYPQFARTIVDHNDISDWTSAGVEVDGPNDDMGSCKYDFRTRTPNARITHNFIHHNLEQNLGYGVVVSKDGYAMIDGQMFVSNRHAIASDGHPGSSYRAWYNLVLSYGPLQRGPFDWPFHTQDFDMHGMLSGGFGGTAGDYVDIFRNTFLGTNRPNFELRGYPCAYDQFHENISLESLDDALKWKLVDFRLGDDASVDYSNPYLRASESPNQFGHSNPTGHFGVGDFDGDGADDLFLATGAAWYYSPAGKAEWRFLSAKTDTIDRVLFGDFDGDGRTDVIAVHGSQFVISWGGISDWEVLNPFSARGAISDMAVGDFIGDQRPDIFFADGSQWYLSDGGREPFLAMNTSSFRVPDLRFGDFDGDGKTDVFGIVSGKWQYTKSALSGWIPLRDAMVSNINALIVADFNGDRHADVGANCDDPGCWRISYWGTEDWKYFPEPFGLTGSPLAGVGHFLGHIWTDVLSWNVRNAYWMCDPNIGQDTQFCMSVAGISRTQRYSTQDMR